jgi:hypothetical protein
MRYFRRVRGDIEVAVQTDGQDIWVLHHSTNKDMLGKKLSNPFSDLIERGWEELVVEVGTKWIDRIHGIEYEILKILDYQDLLVSWFSGRGKGQISIRTLMSKYDPAVEDAGYTEGYKRGHTGLRWL